MLRFDQNTDFSLVLGGPLYQLFLRAHLAGPVHTHLLRRILVLVLWAWLPLMFLSVISGKGWGGVAVPFFDDLDIQIRFLVVLPILIGAEIIVHQRLGLILRGLVERGIIIEAEKPRFQKIIASALRLRNSVPAEIGLLIAVYTLGIWIWRERMSLPGPTWFATPTSGRVDLNAAGYWYAWVSIPVFQFILLRWYYRLFIWWRLLWQVGRLSLRLIPTHPDRVGGLQLLSISIIAFEPVWLAHTVMISGMIANRIWHMQARLPEFKFEIGGVILLVLILALAPLAIFSLHLARTRRQGLREYGLLAQEYVREFDDKWIRQGADEEKLLGSPDLQSLADLANSFNVIREMKLFPIDHKMVMQLIITLLLPLLPLFLTMFPLDQLLARLVRLAF